MPSSMRLFIHALCPGYTYPGLPAPRAVPGVASYFVKTTKDRLCEAWVGAHNIE